MPNPFTPITNAIKADYAAAPAPPKVNWPKSTPSTPMNQHHADAAEAIIKAYAEYTGSEYNPTDPSDTTAIRDFLADLFHLCDRINKHGDPDSESGTIDLDREIIYARRAYQGDLDEPMTMSGEWIEEEEN